MNIFNNVLKMNFLLCTWNTNEKTKTKTKKPRKTKKKKIISLLVDTQERLSLRKRKK